MKACLLLSMAAATLACGGGSGSPGMVTGTVGGASFSSVADAAALMVTGTTCGGVDPPANVLVIEIADRGGLCNQVTTLSAPNSLTSLSITFDTFWVNPGSASPPASSPAFVAGTYDLGSSVPPDANGFSISIAAIFDRTDASCASTISGPLAAGGGSVTLSSISSSGVTGTFNINFPGGTLTGSFNTEVCAVTNDQYCNLVSSKAQCGS